MDVDMQVECGSPGRKSHHVVVTQHGGPEGLQVSWQSCARLT